MIACQSHCWWFARPVTEEFLVTSPGGVVPLGREVEEVASGWVSSWKGAWSSRCGAGATRLMGFTQRGVTELVRYLIVTLLLPSQDAD